MGRCAAPPAHVSGGAHCYMLCAKLEQDICDLGVVFSKRSWEALICLLRFKNALLGKGARLGLLFPNAYGCFASLCAAAMVSSSGGGSSGFLGGGVRGGLALGAGMGSGALGFSSGGSTKSYTVTTTSSTRSFRK